MSSASFSLSSLFASSFLFGCWVVNQSKQPFGVHACSGR
jgi:hypothetical protein